MKNIYDHATVKKSKNPFKKHETMTFDEVHSEFLDQHDFLEEPTRQTKSYAAWTRENILLDTWNQFINCEAKFAEFAEICPKGKGFRYIGDQRRCDLALGFAHYFLASMEQQVKMIDEENDTEE